MTCHQKPSQPCSYFSVSASYVVIFNFKITFKTLIEESPEHGMTENRPALARAGEKGRDDQAGLSYLCLFGELISRAQ